MTVNEFFKSTDWSKITLGELRKNKNGRHWIEGKASQPYGAGVVPPTVPDADRQRLVAALEGYNDMWRYWDPGYRKRMRDCIRKAKKKLGR